MKKRIFIVSYLTLALVIGCNTATKNTKTTVEKPAFMRKDNKPHSTHLAIKKQEPKKDQKRVEVRGDIRRYFSLPYRHIVGYDTLNCQLRICKNVFTFFVENPDLTGLKRFKNAGFPMEFWSTSMCAFYGVPVSQVTHYLKKAESLGYKQVGYDARLISEKDSTSFVLSNRMNVHFDRHTAQKDINEVINEVPGIRLEGGSLDYAFVVSVTSNRLSDILARFNALKSHRLVKFVEFLPETCVIMI